MQLMTFNSLLMFDIVFVFFLFLVGVTCLVYYLPPSKQSISHCRVNHNSSATTNANTGDNDDDDAEVDGGRVDEDGDAIDYPRRMHQRSHHQCYHHQHNAQHHYHVQRQQHMNNKNPTIFHREHHLPDHNNHERMKNFTCKHHHKHCAANYKLLSNNIEFYAPQYSSHDERYEMSLQIPPPPLPPSLTTTPSFCYIKAKRTDVRNGAGPIEDV